MVRANTTCGETVDIVLRPQTILTSVMLNLATDIVQNVETNSVLFMLETETTTLYQIESWSLQYCNNELAWLFLMNEDLFHH